MYNADMDFLKQLLLPPGINFTLIIIGCLVLTRWRTIGKLIITLSIISLYLFSTPYIANSLIGHLENFPVLELKQLPANQAKAIVLLTSGNSYAPEYGGSNLSGTSLLRALFAAKLYKTTQLPIIISGGEIRSETQPESTETKRALENMFQVPVWQIEARSQNTYENALYSASILKAHQIKNFYLVTSAWHMRRALWSFHQFGLYPIPAATDYAIMNPASRLMAWMPSPTALSRSYLALHEYIGLLWYQFHY